MKFFETSQIRRIDQYTIKHEPIASIDLMERAAETLFRYFIKRFDIQTNFYVFAGPGNNGGDALALSRKLLEYGYNVFTYYFGFAKLSKDCSVNLQRLKELFPDYVSSIEADLSNVNLKTDAVIVDGLFGSGLTRPAEGIYADTIRLINQANNYVVAIDIPSGLNGEENTDASSAVLVKADLTLSLHFPKLAFFFPENNVYVKEWLVLAIGLHPDIIQHTESKYNYLVKSDISNLLKQRNKFSHKGNFGQVFIFGGKKGMGGAAVLNAKASLRSGAGLVSVYSNKSNRIVIQTSVPEAIFESKSKKAPDTAKYNAFALGSGIGKSANTVNIFEHLLENIKSNCVIDADGLNILSANTYLLDKLPENSILTPHPKEFERLFGESKNTFERMQKALKISKELKIYIVLKGAYTLISCPDGNAYFNTSGNPGMATAGSGDVLTGIIAGLLSQKYAPKEAAIVGVYLHGLAGDCALSNNSVESLTAGDIVDNIGKAFKLLRNR